MIIMMKVASLVFRGTKVFDNKTRTILDTEAKVRNTFCPTLVKLGPSTPTMPAFACDGEGGATYGWDGPLTIFQFQHFKRNHTFLFEVTKLGPGFFDICGEKG